MLNLRENSQLRKKFSTPDKNSQLIKKLPTQEKNIVKMKSEKKQQYVKLLIDKYSSKFSSLQNIETY